MKNYETYLKTKDGKKIPILFDGSVMKNKEGNIGCVVCTARETNGHKFAEEALRESEDWSRLLVEYSTDTFFLHDFDGRIIDVNQHACESLGYTREELLGLSIQDIDEGFVPGKHAEKWKQMVPGVPITLEGVHKRKDGTTFPIEVRLGGFELGGRKLMLGLVRDITDRKLAEEVLRTEKQKFQTLSENAPLGMMIIDQAGNFKYVNPKFRELFGYDLNDLPDARTWFRKAYPDPAYRHDIISAWINDNDLGSFQPGEQISKETTVTCRDGTEKIINFLPVRLETGGYLTTCVDITIQKKGKEALQESENKFRCLVENSMVGVYLIQDGVFKYVNSRFAEIHGYEMEEIVDKIRIKETILPEDLPILDGNINKRTKGEDETVHCEFRIVTKSQETKDVEVFSSRTMYQGRPAIIGTLLDITERKRTEEALKKSEKEAKQLSQENAMMAEIGQIISSTLNIHDVYERFAEKVRELIPFDRITMSNINSRDDTVTISYVAGTDVADRSKGDIGPLVGTLTEEVVRTRTNMLIQTEDLKEVADRFPKLLSTFQAAIRSVMAIPLISKDDVIGVLHLQSCNPNAYSDKDLRLAERVGNEIAGAIANAQLFAERKQAEEAKAALQEQLRQSQKMESIGQLAGGVAHDFNNILTVIHGYSELVMNSLDSGNPIREDVKEIKAAAERASTLTRQLLAFSRKQVLQPKVIDLNALVSNMAKMLRRMIGEGIELNTIWGDDLGSIKADPGQIEQVILNLAVNARDAMPNGGKLTIETANVELDQDYANLHLSIVPGTYVMLSVSDTGVGMTPEVRERVLEPFFTTKEKGKGTGLGLSTVYGIVKQSGGNIWIYSEPGQGSTFKIYLPRVEEEADSMLQSSVVGTQSEQCSETILLVEDEKMVRNLALTILKRQGYKVLEAENGDAALRTVQEQNGNPIHLMLTDVVMPGMSGHDLSDRLKPQCPGMKVIYMSGYTDEAIVEKHGLSAPGIHYLQKPFPPDTLVKKVRSVLDGPRPRQEQHVPKS